MCYCPVHTVDEALNPRTNHAEDAAINPFLPIVCRLSLISPGNTCFPPLLDLLHYRWPAVVVSASLGVNTPACQPASQNTASQSKHQPASQPVKRPASQPASQQTSQPASQPTHQPAKQPETKQTTGKQAASAFIHRCEIIVFVLVEHSKHITVSIKMGHKSASTSVRSVWKEAYG